MTERRYQQPENDQDQQGQAEPPDGVVGQVQARQDEAAEQGKDREAQRQAEDDEIGPPPRRLGIRPRVRPSAAAEQDDGKHRQDTGGQARNDAADQADQHQRHATTSR